MGFTGNRSSEPENNPKSSNNQLKHESKIKHKYKFTQLIDCLTSFVADFEINTHFVDNKIPVFVQNTGDETYWYNKKWRNSKDEKFKEVYQKVPRCIIEISDDFQQQIEQNTSNTTQFTVNQNDVNLTMKGKRQALVVQLDITFICSNFIYAMQYYEMLLCLLNVDNVYTYISSGNRYQSSYALTTISLQKPGISASGDTKNYTIKMAVELSVQMMLANLRTIKPTKETGFELTGFIIDGYETDNSEFHRSFLNIDDE